VSVSAAKDEPRFAFGKNWRSFLALVDPQRIAAAQQSLRSYLGADDLEARSFLDIGCGSGLFSLAARHLGARVHSFDVDADSVACTRELKRRFAPDDEAWTIDEASVLDRAYLRSLGRFDVVYAWGVLHHTGALWEAIDAAADRVAPGGQLHVAIYAWEPYWTAWWRGIKRTYVWAPRALQIPMEGAFGALQVLRGLSKDLLFGRPPLARYRDRRYQRGMSVRHDWADWLGGYPFDAALPHQVFERVHGLGFHLERLRTVAGTRGCNEYVFRRPSS
jgi:2-polyprenyl-6-hydroxyphenyl methylase/3-demethylubiquinone-9 3-methyltransferase